jgi:hypothetical protein
MMIMTPVRKATSHRQRSRPATNAGTERMMDNDAGEANAHHQNTGSHSVGKEEQKGSRAGIRPRLYDGPTRVIRLSECAQIGT